MLKNLPTIKAHLYESKDLAARLEKLDTSTGLIRQHPDVARARDIIAIHETLHERRHPAAKSTRPARRIQQAA